MMYNIHFANVRIFHLDLHIRVTVNAMIDRPSDLIEHHEKHFGNNYYAPALIVFNSWPMSALQFGFLRHTTVRQTKQRRIEYRERPRCSGRQYRSTRHVGQDCLR